MSSIIIASIAFAFTFGGAMSGLLLRFLLPDHHLNDAGRDVVKLSAGLIATLAALVLGLLISSAKSSLDTLNSELIQTGTRIIELDRCLASYGPETKMARDLLHRTLAGSLEMFRPHDNSRKVSVDNVNVATVVEQIQKEVRLLSPRNDSQRLLQSQAQQNIADLVHSRWLLIEQVKSPMPKAFLVILVFWLTVLFLNFGLLAPHNVTVIAVLLVCALSVSGAIFLILEMNTPLTGMINVSTEPLQNALDHLGK